MEAPVKRRLSDESAGNNGSANGFKIPKRTRRSGLLSLLPSSSLSWVGNGQWIWKPKEKVCDRWVHGGGKGWVGVLLENYWGIFWTFHTFSFWYLHSGVESAPPAWWSIVGLVRFVRWTKTQASKVGALPLISTKNIKLTNTGSPFKYVCLNRRPCESPVNPDKVEANGGEEKVAKTTASSNISIIAGIL